MSWNRRDLLLFVLLGMPLAFTSAFGQQPEAIGELSLYIGDVRIRPQGQEIWDMPELNQPIYQGDALRAGAQSRAEVVMTDENVIRIGEQSIFEFDDITVEDEEVSGSGWLAFGQIWSRVKNLGSDGMEVRSPNAVMAVRGTTWRADAATDSSLSVWVYEGQVDVNRPQDEQTPSDSLDMRGQAPGGPPAPVRTMGPRPVPGPYQVSLEEWVQIVAGTMINVRPDGRYATRQFDMQTDAQNDWVQWNMERDQTMQQR